VRFPNNDVLACLSLVCLSLKGTPNNAWSVVQCSSECGECDDAVAVKPVFGTMVNLAPGNGVSGCQTSHDCNCGGLFATTTP
jgi:hypothetical protein